MDGTGYFNDLSESEDENEVEVEVEAENENEHTDFSHTEFNNGGG